MLRKTLICLVLLKGTAAFGLFVSLIHAVMGSRGSLLSSMGEAA
jgi:hypothetical protein